MLRVEIQPNYLYVEVPYPQKELAKWIGAIEFSRSRKMWKFPNNIYVMRELLRHFPALMNNQTFVDYGKQLRSRMDKLLEIKRMEDAPGDPRLRPYQRVDVVYLKELTAAGVFNEPRTGKTPTILTVMKELKTIRNLVVCPASLTLNWEKEAKIWAEGVQVFRIKGTPKQRGATHMEWLKCVQDGIPSVLIVSKDSLKSKSDRGWFMEMYFDMIVVDEAHFLRNRDSLQSKVVHSLNAHRKYALTGTPTVRDGTDIFGILSWLFPETYTSYWAFVKRYFEVYQDHFGNTVIGDYNHRQSELQELIGFISVQRKRRDRGVMDWLDKPQPIPIPVEMDKKQRKLYDDMLNTFTAYDEESGMMVDTPTVLAQLTRLRQLCLDPALLGFDAPSAKTDAIMEYLEDNPRPVVIMSMFTSYLHLLAEKLKAKGYKVRMIHGEMSNDEKGKAAADFQAGKTDILLCNIISAGVGHTLDRADTIIFTDKAWNPTDQQQAEDRIVPTTPERNHGINIVTFPIADTVDERIEEILEKKTNLTEVINSGAREAIMRLLRR
jgi:SNF2 family DNA or RNA helicase